MPRAPLALLALAAVAAAGRAAPALHAPPASALRPVQPRAPRPEPPREPGTLLAELGARGGLRPGDGYRDPDVWGPPTWFFLHSLTLALPDRVPEDEQRRVRSLMLDLQHLLPCPSCGEHLAEHMRELPIEPHLGTRDGLVQWMIDIHNLVNVNCGKRALSREEVLRLYDAAYAGKGHAAVIGGERSGTAPRATPVATPVGFLAVAALAAALAHAL